MLLIKGITGSRDRRGLVSVTYTCFIEKTNESGALLAALPVKPGLPEVDRRIREHGVDNNSFIVTVTCEGIPPGGAPAVEQDQYVVEDEWREEPIEAFPDRDTLESKYGAYPDDDGRLKFPEFLPGGGTGSGSGLGAGRSSAGEKNPLFGVSTYPVQLATASHAYVRTVKPSGLRKKAGTVIKALPAGFQESGGGPWIVCTPSCRRRGNCWEIVERYKEINNLKHIEALYLLLRKK